MRGNITRRGKGSWRLKFDLGTDPVTGKRLTQFVTVRGTKKEAEAELARRLHQVDGGNYVANSKETVAEHVRGWFSANADPAGTTRGEVRQTGREPDRSAHRFAHLAAVTAGPGHGMA